MLNLRNIIIFLCIVILIKIDYVKYIKNYLLFTMLLSNRFRLTNKLKNILNYNFRNYLFVFVQINIKIYSIILIYLILKIPFIFFTNMEIEFDNNSNLHTLQILTIYINILDNWFDYDILIYFSLLSNYFEVVELNDNIIVNNIMEIPGG